MISIMNTVEYNEYRHGVRDEAIISSMRPFITKMASAAAVAIANMTYLVLHIISYTNGIANLEQSANLGEISAEQKAQEITSLLQGVRPIQTTGLLLVMTILPFALMFFAYWLYQKKYTLVEEEYDRICNELAARKKA